MAGSSILPPGTFFHTAWVTSFAEPVAVITSGQPSISTLASHSICTVKLQLRNCSPRRLRSRLKRSCSRSDRRRSLHVSRSDNYLVMFDEPFKFQKKLCVFWVIALSFDVLSGELLNCLFGIPKRQGKKMRLIALDAS